LTLQVVYLNTYFSHGNRATDFRAGSIFNSSFFYSSLPNLTEKNYGNWSTFAEIIVKNNSSLFEDMVYIHLIYISLALF